ncbi:MAG: ATP-dependent Clp protease ATP-binding subunit [Oscillospiraceae bacterium]|nr:ATP-dependent Clp protease ATP-binding subunit [Oscillospiraceae bacterium]
MSKMPQPTCTRCREQPAMLFVNQIEGTRQVQKALCVRCALQLNIGPIKSLLHSMGYEEDGEALEELLEDDNAFHEMLGAMPGVTAMPGEFGALPARDDDADESPVIKPVGREPVSVGASKQRKGKKNVDKSRRYLSQFCTDLTARARDGKLDRVIGRDDEIARSMQILCRRSKNNPCLIGEPGVGKTAIAEGLAQRIAAGEVPMRLIDKEIQLLDMTSMVAGTQYRGQFEARIKGLIEEVKTAGNIILFIDEVHTLVGAGDAEGAMNAANILKPALSRGEVQIIGATTFTEYRKYIEKDSALERRLQPVKVEEPSIEDTVRMLAGVKSYYEDFHRVKVGDSIIRKAVVLSERYISDRFLPDKAIDLLDEACTCANLRNKAIDDCERTRRHIQKLLEQQQKLMDQPEPDYEKISEIRSEAIREEARVAAMKEQAEDNLVTEDDLARVIQLWTGVPAQKIIESDMRRLCGMEEALQAHIIGQDEAVAAVACAIRRSRVQISPQRRPASFIFVGPTGVGKTELVKRLAAELFDKPDALIRLDMSEFMEKHAVSRIIGSPPGYVGYDDAGQLTEKVRRRPYSIVLFDEIEKAHPDVMNILLQILDEGRIHDAQGRDVDFASTVIIMTSNAGSERRDAALGFGQTKAAFTQDRAQKALKDFLRPEFLGRVDEIIYFRDLNAEDFVKIALLHLEELRESLLEKGIVFTWSEQAVRVIAEQAAQGSRGARDLRNALRRRVEDPITAQIVQAVDGGLSQVALSEDAGDVLVVGV